MVQCVHFYMKQQLKCILNYKNAFKYASAGLKGEISIGTLTLGCVLQIFIDTLAACKPKIIGYNEEKFKHNKQYTQ